MLNLAVNPFEFRYEANQELKVMHHLQGFGNTLAASEDIEKGLVDLLAAAEFIIHQVEVFSHQFFKLNAEWNPVLLGVFESLHKHDGVFFKSRFIGKCQFPPDNIKTIANPPPF